MLAANGGFRCHTREARHLTGGFLTKIRLDERRLAQATDEARADFGIILLELGKNAFDAGARVLRIGIARDSAGTPTAVTCRHDGACLTRDELAEGLRRPWPPKEQAAGGKLGRFGLGLISLAAFCRHVEFHCGRPDRKPFSLALDRAAHIATIAEAEVERRVGSGPNTRIKLIGLDPDLTEQRADLVLQALPIGPEFAVWLDDFEGMAQVRPRSYGGTLLDSGTMSFAWPGGSADSKYELRLLDDRRPGSIREAGRGLALVRDGLVLLNTTMGMPVRKSDLARLVGWFEVGDWLLVSPATLRLEGRRGATRAFQAAARQLINEKLAGLVRPPEFLNPPFLAKLASELTQRLSKAVHSLPELAPVLDLEPARARHRDVLDIPFHSAVDRPWDPLRSPLRGIRVRFALNLPPGGPPVIWDSEDLTITLNAGHDSAIRMAASPAQFEVWAAKLTATLVGGLRPGRSGVLLALEDASRLLAAAYSPSATPTSTRSQRERRKRLEDQARLEAQVRSRV